MPISWNEIRQNAIAFSKAWADESRESAERQTFWNELFEVFGQKRRLVASFEEPVRKLSGTWGAIDLFWKGTMLAEHKTRGHDLGKAHAQAIGYIQGLKDTGREDEIPRYVVVSDFALIAVHDLEDGTSAQFPLADFYKHAASVRTSGFGSDRARINCRSDRPFPTTAWYTTDRWTGLPGTARPAASARRIPSAIHRVRCRAGGGGGVPSDMGESSRWTDGVAGQV